MSDQGNVSTEDTPPPRNEISVVTEESQAAKAPDSKATPPVDDGKSQSSDASATSTQDNGDGKSAKPRNRRQERERRKMRKDLDEANTRATAAEADSSELRQRLDDIEAKMAVGPKREKPKLADYTDPDKFAADYAAWEAAEKAPTKKAPAKKQPDPPPKKASDTEHQPEELVELHKEGKARYGDEFADVIGQDDLPLSVNMIEYIFDDEELGPELVLWADDNRSEAEKIYKMGPVRTVKALDKVRETLTKGEDRSGTIDVKDDKQAAADTASRKVSKAKEPPGDGVKTSTADADTSVKDGLSMDEYASRRKADERKKRGFNH